MTSSRSSVHVTTNGGIGLAVSFRQEMNLNQAVILKFKVRELTAYYSAWLNHSSSTHSPEYRLHYHMTVSPFIKIKCNLVFISFPSHFFVVTNETE